MRLEKLRVAGTESRTEERPHLVAVALPLPIPRTFTYAVTSGAAPPVGSRVLVPFRRRERIGWVTRTEVEPVPGMRPVLDVLDDGPVISPELLELARWIADYYMAPLGLALRAALPSVLTDSSRDYVELIADEAGTPTLAPPLSRRERRVMEALRVEEGPQRVARVRKTLSMGSIWPEIRSLQARALLRHTTLSPKPPSVRTVRMVSLERWLSDLAERDELLRRTRRQKEAYEIIEAAGGRVELSHLIGRHGFSRSVVQGLQQKGIVTMLDEEVMRDPFRDQPPTPPPGHRLTSDQQLCVRRLVGALDSPSPKPFLLHGVTASGKTLVYIELLRSVLAKGRGAIVLVPEISLTPQTVSRFRSHFGDQVAVLHSGLSDGERYDAWRQLRAGVRRIAVGARSALFAPIADLGAIVVDEEHDGSYKQSETPRYHARDLAVVRAGLAGAVCVLGSATPALESWSNVSKGKFEVLSLPERVGGGALPPVVVIDLRAERRRVRDSGERSTGVLSGPLREAMESCLAREEQTILLLNRRGFSSFVQCRDCGDVHSCAHCSITLTYHRVSGRLVCHHCRYEEPAPERCRRCESEDLSFRGLGTEQVERVVAETFPTARIARMDMDTTSAKGSHHEILSRVERGEVDILLGTQMIAKGLDFPRVTVVGVVNADVGIHLPDFRASERSFQLLSQVAGRAGRGPLGGEVFIQTSLPDHHAIRAAVAHDYEAFAKRELEERRRPLYPPYARLVNVIVSSPDPQIAADVARRAANWLSKWIRDTGSQVELVGPAPSPIERLHGRWRWHFLLRATSVRGIGSACRELIGGFRPGGRDVRLVIDRDPTQLL